MWRISLDENGRAVDTKEKAGWQNNPENLVCSENRGTVDESVNGWANVGDIWFNSTKGVGTIKTGWQNVADKTWLYLKDDGTADKTKNGMQNINDKVYFLKDGVAQSGKQAVNGKEYMFDAAKELQHRCLVMAGRRLMAIGTGTKTKHRQKAGE
mgnify:CR=1 FL=1